MVLLRISCCTHQKPYRTYNLNPGSESESLNPGKNITWGAVSLATLGQSGLLGVKKQGFVRGFWVHRLRK